MSDQQPAVPQAKNVSIEEMNKADKDDASMEAYKAKLLGGAIGSDGKAVAKYPNDPRKVIVESVKIVFDDAKAPQQELVLDVKTPDQVIVIKEGTTFTSHVTFYVQHDIALGLKMSNATSKLGITVDSDTAMLGSFAPKLEPYTVKAITTEAPTGMLARTSYTFKSTLHDDDGKTHNVFTAVVKIQSDWK